MKTPLRASRFGQEVRDVRDRGVDAVIHGQATSCRSRWPLPPKPEQRFDLRAHVRQVRIRLGCRDESDDAGQVLEEILIAPLVRGELFGGFDMPCHVVLDAYILDDPPF